MTLPDFKGADISVIVSEVIASGCQRDFRGIYDSLPERKVVKAPKSAFVDRIAAITMKHPNTVPYGRLFVKVSHPSQRACMEG